MKKTYLLLLEDILDAVGVLQDFAEESDYLKNRDKLSAFLLGGVMMQIAIIGESANKIPRDVRESYSHIPWAEMISTRNVIVHNYSGIDLDTIWEVIHQDLPVLKRNIKEMIIKERGIVDS